MAGEHPVIEALRKTLVSSSSSSAAFLRELEERVRQLIADMVDGRVLPKADAVVGVDRPHSEQTVMSVTTPPG